MPDALVTTDWLEAHLHAPDVHIIDATWFLPTIDRNASTRMLGKCLNSWMQEEGLSGISMTTQKYAPDHPSFGSLAIATPWNDLTYSLRWKRAGWFDAIVVTQAESCGIMVPFS